MELDQVFINSLTKKLKCTLCQNYLSYFPIKSSKNGHICGRCTAPSENYVQNKVYEAACQWIKFPCIFKDEGCKAKVFPQNMAKHEENCAYKIICPVKSYTLCQWRGFRSKLLQHCQLKHSNLFLENFEFDLDVEKSHEKHNFVQYGDELLLLIHHKYSSANKLVHFLISSITNKNKNSKYFCELTFTSGDKNFRVECNLANFNEPPTKITFDATQSENNFCKVVDLEGQQLKNEMLSLLECSFCSGFVLPPIYQFDDGTLKCSDCLTRKDLTNGNKLQNFNLDRIAHLLNYPCKYRKIGCEFISKPDVMKNHLLLCEYLPHCPLAKILKCNWKGSQENLRSHLACSKHRRFYYKNKLRGYIQLNLGNFSEYAVIEVEKHIFKLKLKQKSDRYNLMICLLEKPLVTFQYKFNILDVTNTSLEFSEICPPSLLKHKRAFCSQQLAQFGIRNIVNFEITINV